MEPLLRIGLSNAVAALLLALVVVTVACRWRRPAVLHALWLLVLVKLVTPPLVWLPEPWAEAAADVKRDEPIAERTIIVPPPPEPPPAPAAADGERDDAPVSAPPLDLVFAPVPEPQAFAAPPEAPSAEHQDACLPPSSVGAPPTPPALLPWMTAVGGVWLAGSLAWYALAVHRLRRFRGLLRHATPAPESLRQRTQRLAEKLRLRRCPAVWLVPGRVAPMLWAAGGRPRVLFPAALLDRMGVEQQNALIVHELAHLRRRDHWVRWLEFVAAGLYWWTPVLWFARRELREAEELCCDAWVTSTLPGAGKAYAVALLETLDFLSDCPPAVPLLASGVGRVSDLKRRLTMIMRGTTPRALGWRGLLAVIGLGGLLLPLLPAWVRAEPPAKVDPDKMLYYEVVKSADVLRIAPPGAAPEEIEKAQAELKELEAQLAQKQEEVAALTAKVQAARAKMPKADQGGLPLRVVVTAAPDANYAAVLDLLKRVQAAQQPNAAPEIIVIDAATGKIIMKSEGAKPQPMPQPALIQWRIAPATPGVGLAPIATPPPGGISAAPPAPPDADKRIDELEKKLKSILDEVEQLHKERKPAAPETTNNAPLHSYGPTPQEQLEQIPLLNRLFRTGAPANLDDQAMALAAARDQLQKQLDELRARTEAERVSNVALEQARAQVQAAEAALEQAEAQHDAALEIKAKTGAVLTEDKPTAAEVAVRRATLEQAKAVLNKTAADRQARQAENEDRVKAAEERLKQLGEELLKLKEKTNEDAPKKP